MPDRIVRASILTSDPVNQLSWPAEVFYRRLFSIVDDFGRYDGRVAILRAQLYPLKLGSVAEPDVGKWLSECESAGLVRVYEIDGRPYLEVHKFGQRLRSKDSKWPDPPTSADICQQVSANDGLDVDVDVVVFGDVVVSEGDKRFPQGFPFPSERFLEAWNLWKEYARSIGKPINEIVASQQWKEMKPLGEARAIAMIEATIRNRWKNLREDRREETKTPTRKTASANDLTI